MSSSSLELLWLSVCFAGLSSSFASSGSNNQGQFLSSLRSVAIPGHCLQLHAVCFTPDLLGNSTPFIFYPAIGWTFSTQVFTVFSSLATVSTLISPLLPVIKPRNCAPFSHLWQLFLPETLRRCPSSSHRSVPAVNCFWSPPTSPLWLWPLSSFCSSLRISKSTVRAFVSSPVSCFCLETVPSPSSVNCSRLHFASTSVTVCTVPVFTSTQAPFLTEFLNC